jgi:hypothetical protein
LPSGDQTGSESKISGLEFWTPFGPSFVSRRWFEPSALMT